MDSIAQPSVTADPEADWAKLAATKVTFAAVVFHLKSQAAKVAANNLWAHPRLMATHLIAARTAVETTATAAELAEIATVMPLLKPIERLISANQPVVNVQMLPGGSAEQGHDTATVVIIVVVVTGVIAMLAICCVCVCWRVDLPEQAPVQAMRAATSRPSRYSKVTTIDDSYGVGVETSTLVEMETPTLNGVEEDEVSMPMMGLVDDEDVWDKGPPRRVEVEAQHYDDV